MPYFLPMGITSRFLGLVKRIRGPYRGPRLHFFLMVPVFILAFSSVAHASETPLELYQKERLMAGLEALEREREHIRSQWAQAEQHCLSKFISGACLEEARQTFQRADRALDLAKASMQLELRIIQAQVRQRSRQDAVVAHEAAMAKKVVR